MTVETPVTPAASTSSGSSGQSEVKNDVVVTESGEKREACSGILKNLIRGDPVNTSVFHGDMAAAKRKDPVTEFGQAGSQGRKLTNFRNSGLANGAGKDACDNYALCISNPQLISSRFFIGELLSECYGAGDLPEMIGTLLHVLP